jgi:hypothetical protein
MQIVDCEVCTESVQNLRGAGAEDGIPTMMGKEFAGMPWVKAGGRKTQKECSP